VAAGALVTGVVAAGEESAGEPPGAVEVAAVLADTEGEVVGAVGGSAGEPHPASTTTARLNAGSSPPDLRMSPSKGSGKLVFQLWNRGQVADRTAVHLAPNRCAE